MNSIALFPGYWLTEMNLGFPFMQAHCAADIFDESSEKQSV
ncbi:hypothetical protein HCH_04304 [Hahella chejuensis KCTC 2396]|uniref:Uncharacterized protein n=1 Tax=Hahella chejuensis (strain KCTC 2396) TaxID=349521 RepID=Q2SEB3_HAHCH|nr:hypothetical protein HCH_04304 [Hahella chejuensis KCTC 2396]